MSKGDMDSDIPKTASRKRCVPRVEGSETNRQTLPENSLFLSDEKTETNRTDRKTGTGKNGILPYEILHII